MWAAKLAVCVRKGPGCARRSRRVWGSQSACFQVKDAEPSNGHQEPWRGICWSHVSGGGAALCPPLGVGVLALSPS